jgi:hypothetical protein
MAPGFWRTMVLVALFLAPAAQAAEGSGWVILHAGLTDARASAIRSDMLQLGFTRYQTGRALALEEYAFGGAELWAREGSVSLCPMGKPRHDVETVLLRGQGALDAWDYEGAARILQPVMGDLACFSEPAEAVTLAKAAMYLGYALFEGGRTAEAKAAFTRAAAFDATTRWDDRYPPDAGRVFGGVVAEAEESPAARLQVLDAFKLHPEIRIDGGTFPGDGALAAGEHRVLVRRRDEGEQSFAVALEAGQTASLVPADTIIEALFSGGEGHDAAADALAAAMEWTGAAEAYIAVPEQEKVYRFQAATREIRVVPGPPEGGTVAAVTPPPVQRPPTTTGPRTLEPLSTGKQQQIAGVLVLGIGGATAITGFAVHGAHYQWGTEEADRVDYERQREANQAGFVMGVAGAAAAVTGFILLVDPRARESQVPLVPGPVITATGRF